MNGRHGRRWKWAYGLELLLGSLADIARSIERILQSGSDLLQFHNYVRLSYEKNASENRDGDDECGAFALLRRTDAGQIGESDNNGIPTGTRIKSFFIISLLSVPGFKLEN